MNWYIGFTSKQTNTYFSTCLKMLLRMKKVKLNHCLLLALLVLFIACNEQTKPIRSKNKSKTATKTNQQIAEYIRHIFQDKNGGFWLGTNNFGVAHFNGDSLSYYSIKQGFGGVQITGIAEDTEKNLWFATDKGIVKYDWSATADRKKKFTNYLKNDYFKGRRFWSIFADSKGIIWAGTGENVYCFDGSNWKPFELPYTKDELTLGLLTNVTVWTITEDTKGNIWFGTNGNGAIQYDGTSFVQFLAKDGLAGNSVDPIMEDSKGNIWLGTRFGGLSKFDGKTFTNYSQKNYIGNNEVCIVYEDSRGNIWCSSEGFGVYRYNGDSFTNFYKAQGLGVKAVQTIYEDREGTLWVGGGGGLYRFDGAIFTNVKKNGPW